MGTRGIFGLRYKNKDKITYNHFDSYPEGLGISFLEQVKKFNISQIKKVFGKIKLVKDEEKKPTKEEINKYKKYSDTSVGESMNNQEVHTYYQLLRNVQGKIENYLSGEVDIMIDSSGFIKDSLFCEWGYIINLDTGKLEVWKGFQTSPQENRYKETPKELKKESDWWTNERPNANWKKEYYNCALVKEYDLNKLPGKKKFLEDLKEKEE